MNDEYFDVVIVGAGVAGATIAKVLSGAGRSVLLLEAGTSDALDPAKYRSYLEAFYLTTIKATSSGYPPNPDAPYADVLQIGKGDDSYLVQNTRAPMRQTDGSWAVPFLSDYLRMAGGTTLHWQGSSLRMVPNDFRIRTNYGRGVDWPISYDDLMPYYALAEHEIGVAADVGEQAYFGIRFPDGYVYPMHKMPQSYLDQFFIQHLDGLKVPLGDERLEVRVISVPQARNSTPNPSYAAPDGTTGYQPVSAIRDRNSGLRCQGNSSCMPICPVQAKYSALKTIDSIVRRPRVRLESQAVASRLEIDPGTGRITGVEYKAYQDPTSARHASRVAHGTVVVLAANAIENVTLMLASQAAPNNRHLGRNLMDHPYLYVWGSAPQPVYPFRGPDTTSGLDSLRDGKFRTTHAAFRASLSNWGWSGSPRNEVRQLIEQQHYGSDLRVMLRDKLIRQVKVGVMVEQLPDANNRVRIDTFARDRLGNSRPVIDYSIDEYSLAGIAAARDVVARVFAQCGVDDQTNYGGGRAGSQYVTHNGRGYNLMGSGHIVGTHRMGDRSSDSVIDRNLRSWEHDNLYVVGCGSMPTIGTSNPTLTGVALAFKAAAAIQRALR